MLIIIYNEPLLFVQAPPVFIRVTVTDEESTSVFVLNGEEPTDSSDTEQTEEQTKEQSTEAVRELADADSSVNRRITYLGLPFQRQVYQPLQFVLNDETLTGAIEKIQGKTVLIDQGEEQIIAIEIDQIEEILWRGRPFVEN